MKNSVRWSRGRVIEELMGLVVILGALAIVFTVIGLLRLLTELLLIVARSIAST